MLWRQTVKENSQKNTCKMSWILAPSKLVFWENIQRSSDGGATNVPHLAEVRLDSNDHLEEEKVS